MDKNVISGTVIPFNLAVYYSFPRSTLNEAQRFFGGDPDTVWVEGESLLQPLKKLDESEFKDSDEEIRHINVILTYSHEQFHLRHLTASPIGLLLYMIGARQFAYVYAALQRWGERIGQSPGAPIHLPLRTHHSEDAEIQEIERVWTSFGIYQSLFMDSLGNVTLLDITGGGLKPLLDEVQILTSRALNIPDQYPLLDLQENFNEPANPTAGDNQLTGRAVLEGLARMNELITLGLIGIPLDAINHIVAGKMHGIYGHTIAIAGALLKVQSTRAWMIVAKLSDWALQAPVLPFLLRGRETVPIMELLPSWRYMLLVSRFKQAGFTLDDLLKREREVAANLFGGLGWSDPWQIAESILQINVPAPKSVLTRHYWENLQLGARLRMSDPSVLSFPDLGDEGYKLQALFNIFSDGIAQRVGSRLSTDPERWSLLLSLVTDVTAEALLLGKNLKTAFQYAKWVSDFTGGQPSSAKIVRKALVYCLGEVTAARVFDDERFK